MSRKHYSTEFRDQVVELYKSGRSASSLSREFGPSTQTILHWVHRDERDRDGEAIKNSPEYRRLQRELARVQEERDILAKATAWFAQDGGKTRGRSTSS